MSQFLDGLNLDVCSNQRRYRVQHLSKSDKFEITFYLFDSFGDYYPGWWYTYPSEKYESQLGLYIIPNTWKVIKLMFQTTNQIDMIYVYIFGLTNHY